MKKIALAVVSILVIAAACGVGSRSRADDCAGLQVRSPRSFVGTIRPDPDDPTQPDAKWLGRIGIAESYYEKFPGGPIWDGDSTANDDANDLSTLVAGTRQTEYARLGWAHPIDWAVGGDATTNVMYRLYAMEQGLDVSGGQAPPASLKRGKVNLLSRVASPFIVIHVGTNNLPTTESVANVAADIEALTCELHRDMPLVPKIVVVGLYPRGPFFNYAVSRREQINAALSEAATRKWYPFVFVDATQYLETLCQGHFDKTGQCFYFKDEIHPKAPASYGVDKLIRDALAKP